MKKSSSGEGHHKASRQSQVRDSGVGGLGLGSRQVEVEEENILEEDLLSENLLDQQDQEESQVVVNQEHNLVDLIGSFQGLFEDETEAEDMTEEKDFGIATVKRFDGESFHLWKFQMQMLLELKGLLGVVNGSEEKPASGSALTEWTKKDVKAKSFIAISMEMSQVQHIVNCKTSNEMWTQLEALYEQKTRASKNRLKSKEYVQPALYQL